MFWQAVGDVLAQALVIGINPVGVTAAILVLLSEKRRSNGILFVASWALCIFVTAGLAYLLTEAGNADEDETVADGIDLVRLLFGIALVALAVRKWRRRPAPGAPAKEPAFFARVATMSPLGIAGLGAAAALANVKTVPLAAGAGASLAQAPIEGTSAIMALVIFSFVASLTVLAPLVATLVLGDRAETSLRELKTWLLENMTTILVVVLLVVGTLMIGQGLAVFG